MKKQEFRHAAAFISSTFSDMIDERNLVMYNILPRVKKWAFDRGVIFDIVDLRWGISDEQSRDLHHTIKICLQKVKECAPIFLCFLGERYGWIPGEDDFNQSMFDRDISPYKDLSATELEIIQAIDSAFFESSPKSSLFLFRSPLDFNNVPTDLKLKYTDEQSYDKLRTLKKQILQKYPVIQYSAEFDTSQKNYPLQNFSTDGSPLEDVLFERIIAFLKEKYNINDDILIAENEIELQRFHLKQLSLFPRVDHCHALIEKCLESTHEYGFGLIGTTSNSASYSQIAQFILEQNTHGQQILYRFIGIDSRISSINDVAISLACELKENNIYRNDPIGALLFLKKELKETRDKVLLIIAGISQNDILNYINVLSGLKFYKCLFVIETEDRDSLSYYIDYTNDSFEALTRYLLIKKAKTLSTAQMDFILKYANKDYSRVKLLISYLCTFASYETLDKTLDDLVGLDYTTLTNKYLEQLIRVQDSHKPVGIMRDVLELLCHSPLPLTKEDIVDVILSSRGLIDYSHQNGIVYKEKDEIIKEVSFSLAFARDYIEEYNSRFKINNDTVKRIIMFQAVPNMSETMKLLPKESSLIIELRSIYLSRFITRKSIDYYDACNFCEIIKDYSDPSIRELFLLLVIKENENFYKLAKALNKKELIDLFKTLSMQSMGYDVESYFSKTMKKNMHIDIATGSFQGILKEKLFSIFRKNHPDNEFGRYYTAVLVLKNGDIASSSAFTAFINNNIKRKEQDDSYFTVQLPSWLRITKNNITCYTTFDPTMQTYITRYCCCGDGFAFIGDVFSGEMTEVYTIPCTAGEVVSTFYQERTLHIIFEQGVITTIDLLNRVVNSYIFANHGDHLRQIIHYYDNGREIAVANENCVVIYNAMIDEKRIQFSEEWRILAAYGVPINKNDFKVLIIIAQNTNGRISHFAIDAEKMDILSSFNYNNTKIKNIAQDNSNGKVYLMIDNDYSLVLQYDGETNIEIDIDDTQMNCFHGSCRVCKKSDGIYCNNHLVPNVDNIISCFSTREVYGFVTDKNILYCFDNGY